VDTSSPSKDSGGLDQTSLFRGTLHFNHAATSQFKPDQQQQTPSFFITVLVFQIYCGSSAAILEAYHGLVCQFTSRAAVPSRSHLFLPEPRSFGTFQDDGFCNLRLSRRSNQIRTRHTFEIAAFSTISMALHAESLSRLRDIPNHPRFGKLIKKLFFTIVNHFKDC
jgi:hypothetical protein